MTTHEQVMQQWRRVDEEQAKLHVLQAQYDAENGDDLGAEWHRLSAASLRTRTPEAKAAEDRAWLVMMATSHLRRGTAPDADSHRAAEIEETMDEVRDASEIADLVEDRPSHSTTRPTDLGEAADLDCGPTA